MSNSQGQTSTISANSKFILLEIDEIWRYRELFLFLALRDIKLRYKQTVLGILWVVLQPLLAMAVFSVFFGFVVDSNFTTVPYPIFVLSGLLPWLFFVNGATFASNSLITNSNLIKKVYFPRIIAPMACVLSGLLDLVIGTILLFVMSYWYDAAISWKTVFFPLAVLYLCLTTCAVSFWLSALNALYRDIKHIVPFFLQLWMFLSPVVYPSHIVSDSWQMLYSLNPMVGAINLTRHLLFGEQIHSMAGLQISIISAICLLLSGIYYFRKMESIFADVV